MLVEKPLNAPSHMILLNISHIWYFLVIIWTPDFFIWPRDTTRDICLMSLMTSLHIKYCDVSKFQSRYNTHYSRIPCQLGGTAIFTFRFDTLPHPVKLPRGVAVRLNVTWPYFNQPEFCFTTRDLVLTNAIADHSYQGNFPTTVILVWCYVNTPFSYLAIPIPLPGQGKSFSVIGTLCLKGIRVYISYQDFILVERL